MGTAGVATRSYSSQLEQLRLRLGAVVRGKQDVIDLLTTALLAGGSVLLEDVPGVGKTTLAKTLAASVELDFQRVQCTPDLLPADIFGFSNFNPQDGSFRFTPGPIFCNLLLVDEINRASPRTQSALLEAMAEGQVTIEAAHHVLAPPFMVLATQNPVGSRGTFPLPESQLDRFLFQLSVGYPDEASELEMLYDHTLTTYGQVEVSLTKDELVSCQEDVRQVRVERVVGGYLLEIVRRTRENPRIRIGASPRGALMLFRAAQAAAFLEGRDFVIPDDILRIAPAVLHHRIVPVKTSESHSAAQREIILEILAQVRIPV